jgi:hypothetical protein
VTSAVSRSTSAARSAGQQVAHVEIGQGGGDAAQLGQNGAALGLGGVGGEDEVDVAGG